MRKKTLLLLIAGFVVLALFAPVVSATATTEDYPKIAQFIAYYDEDKLSGAGTSPDAGTTYSNEEVTTSFTRTVTTTLGSEDWPQFMQNVENQGYSACNNIPANADIVNSTDGLGIEVIGSINPVVFKNANGHMKILVMTGYAGFEEPTGLTQVNLTCLDWYNGNLAVDWNSALPRTTLTYGYYSNSWSSAAVDETGTYAYASSDNKTICVRISDGQLMWTFTMEDDNHNGSPTVTGDYVFCSDWSNYYCLNKSGYEQWRFNNADTGTYDFEYAQGTPAYEKVGDNEYIYVTGYTSNYPDLNGYLYKVNVTSGGTEEWGKEQATGNDGFCGSASIDDNSNGYVYVGSYNFNAASGYLYKYPKNGGNPSRNLIEKTDATPSLDLDEDLMYISGGWNGGAWGSTPPGVRCYDISAFTLEWSRHDEGIGGWTCSVAIGDADDDGDTLVFTGTESGRNDYPSYCYNKTYALNATDPDDDGETKWSYPYGGATAAIAWDEVYTVDHGGNLYIFS